MVCLFPSIVLISTLGDRATSIRHDFQRDDSTEKRSPVGPRVDDVSQDILDVDHAAAAAARAATAEYNDDWIFIVEKPESQNPELPEIEGDGM